jgi:hypothetical protein
MILYTIIVHQNKVQLIFLNEFSLDALDAIIEAHLQTTQYLDFTSNNSNLNHLTISVANDLEVSDDDRYLYHTYVIKCNLEGIDLKSHTNMLNFKFGLLGLKADILSTIPYGIMTTLDISFKNKF